MKLFSIDFSSLSQVRLLLCVRVMAATVVLIAALFPTSTGSMYAQSADEHPLPVGVKGTPDKLIAAGDRRVAPNFTLTDAQGRPVTLADYKGRVVLLDFWATWCGGCKLELPWYVEFDNRYRDRGLTVIGVSMDEDGMKVVKPFLEQQKIAYPVVIGDEALGKSFGLQSMPLTLLIDRNGRIAVHHSGVVDKDNFEDHIRELLQ